jgi:hypothetical protein
LQLKFGSLQHAAEKMEMDYSHLSRILNGASHSLEDHLKVLQGAGILPEDITMPRMDMKTFLLLNKEVLNNRQKLELKKYM